MKKIGVLMGGYSTESIISLESGETVFKYLSREEFEPYKVQISKDQWVLIDEKKKKFPVNRHDFSVQLENRKLKFDAVFNSIHGSPGEDGRLQAYFDLIGLPYSGCGFYSSALTFNKKHCLMWANYEGIHTPSSYFLDSQQKFEVREILKKVRLPCFVKPNRSGSSLGSSKVSKESQLESAIKNAFKQDSEIIIDSFLKGTEVTVGVISYKETLTALPITELISENEFFDYEAKYSGKSKKITPARLSQEMTLKIQNIAKRIHHLLKLRGFSRTEFIIVGKTPYFLEINTIPGLSINSIMPKQIQTAGIPLEKLLTEILYEAIEKSIKPE